MPPDVSSAPREGDRTSPWRLPSIVETRPRAGYHHPATKVDVAETLRLFGEECTYGIRAIELRQGTPGVSGLELGRLLVPGRIVLYDQLPSPWHLQGRIGEAESQRLQDAGADIEELEAAFLVHWPTRESLKDFMLLDALMHEIGHHLLQHHKGKRLVRVARTSDHEAFAEAFARRCREVIQASRAASRSRPFEATAV